MLISLEPAGRCSRACLPADCQAERTVNNASEASKPALLGAYKEVDPTSKEVEDAANFAVEQLAQQSNSLFPLKLKQVSILFLCMAGAEFHWLP